LIHRQKNSANLLLNVVLWAKIKDLMNDLKKRIIEGLMLEKRQNRLIGG